jgi:hypothetical protein
MMEKCSMTIERPALAGRSLLRNLVGTAASSQFNGLARTAVAVRRPTDEPGRVGSMS